MGFGQELIESQVCLSHFEREQRVGLAFIALASLLSFLAVVTFFSLYLRNLIRSIRLSTDGSWRFFSTDIDSYFLSLMLADCLLSVGGLMNIKWIIIGHSSCGHYCSAQGAIQQLGAPGVALSNIAISLHTFFVIFFNWNSKSWLVPTAVNLFLWTYLSLLVVIGYVVHQSPGLNFFSPTPTWCWIDKKFVVERLIGDYVYPWLACLLLLVVYSLLFFRLRGWVSVTPDRWSRIRLVRRGSSNRLTQGEFGRAIEDNSESGIGTLIGRQKASKMLWYPVCYIILILPMSIVRWIHFTNDDNPPPFILTAAVATLFKLSGLVNVVLYMLTRPNLLLFRGQNPSARQSGPIAPRSSTRQEGLQQTHTEEVYEFDPLPTSGGSPASPDVHSASTYGSFAAMQLRSPASQTDPGKLDISHIDFAPLAINIPSSRLSNMSGVWERFGKEDPSSRPFTPLTAKFRRSNDDLLRPTSKLPVNEASYIPLLREEASIRTPRPQSRQRRPSPLSRQIRSSFEALTQPRIHSFSPAWEETVRDILKRDNGAKAAFATSAHSSNIRTSTIERIQLEDSSHGRKDREKEMEQLEWTFPAQSPQLHLTFQGAHPRHSHHPQVSSTSDEAPMYHLPMRAQKRPAIRESSYFRRSIMPPSSYRTPSLQELMSPSTSEPTPPFTPTSTLSTSRSPAISTPRTASYTFIPPSQDVRIRPKPSLESPLRQQPIIVAQDDEEQYSRQYVVEEKGPFATDLRLRDSRSRASALRKGRKPSKVTFNLVNP
ncbi:hypothetical protein SCHPADRAFT_854296 [Schizopora paradoxa]|uniref:Uncharacterized protein n=1 Tax=Schizopora paradoxa TaxID=27342 RepID=A0A0H2RRT5_9AGAM|nr:hypothetical protein SCHPADRAFT_854296 [Schizopora paradoxa]